VPSLNQLARPPREMLIVSGRNLPRSRGSIARRGGRAGGGGAVAMALHHHATEHQLSPTRVR
jgi:hypothetical protein